MWRALIAKELRETAGWGLLALAVYLYYVLQATGLPTGFAGQASHLAPGYGTRHVPFVGGTFVTFFVLVSVAFVLVLAKRQTIGEAWHGTWLFLLHRPVPRRTIVAAKLVAGAGLYLACAAVPILLYALWAATPGTHASPFFWSMTLTAWQAWLSMVSVYLGAFLTGVWPGRWLGTRLMPLAAAGGAAFTVQAIPWWWTLGLPALLILDAWLVWSIVRVVGTREY